jgi:hypothetical protein
MGPRCPRQRRTRAVPGSLVVISILLFFISLTSLSPVRAQDFDSVRASKSKATLKITPGRLSFGSVTMPKARSITITAGGNTPVSGTIGSPSAPFSIVSGGGSFELSTGQTRNIAVMFEPSADGKFHSSILITSNASNAARKKIKLSGSARGSIGPTPTPTSTATATATATPTATPTPALVGQVLIAGGVDSPKTSEWFDPGLGQFSATGSLNCPRNNAVGVSLQDGTAMILGGVEPSDGAEIFDPFSRNFTSVVKMSLFRTKFTATALQNGQVLVAGGQTSSCTDNGGPCTSVCSSPPPPTITNTAELYDPTTMGFVGTGNLTTPRESHLAALLNDGRVLLVGGDNDSGSVTSAELYDPTSGKFTATGSPLAPGRHWDALVTLKDGQVLLVGGGADTELFDPTMGSFATSGSLNVSRGGAAVALLQSGKVLVAGGQSCDSGPGCPFLTSAELYDPDSGTFSLTGSMAVNRISATASVLLDGRVLVAGGQMCASEPKCTGIGSGFMDLNSAEIYDPIQGTFSSPPNMTTERLGHVAVLLPGAQ